MGQGTALPKVFKTKFFKNLKTPDTRDQTIAAILHIDEIILQTLNFERLTEKIVNVVLEELGYLQLGYVMIVLSLIDKRRGVLKRISISQTKEAKEALRASSVPFKEIEIALNNRKNYCIKAIKNREAYITNDLSNMLFPAIERGLVKKVQEQLGVKTSIVLPVFSQNIPIGTIIFTLKKNEEKISVFERQILVGFTNAIGIAVEHASLYRSLKEANKKLKELSALKDEFVSIASHELRTPLTAINNYLWMVLHGKAGQLSEKQQFYLDRVAISSQRLVNLVNDMLTISRIERGKIEVKTVAGDIVNLAQVVVEELKIKAEENGLKLYLKPPEEKMPLVLMDGEKIREVLVNLIGNAMKFTEATGEIGVSFRKNEEGGVTTLITDTGRGIASADVPKLFRKFGRLDHSFATIARTSGTGLGLYICKQIIDLHRGKIGVASEVNKGSTFYFDLKKAA